MNRFLLSSIVTFLVSLNLLASPCSSDTPILIYGETHGSANAIKIRQLLGEEIFKTDILVFDEGIPKRLNNIGQQIQASKQYVPTVGSEVTEEFANEFNSKVFGIESSLLKSILILGILKKMLEQTLNNEPRIPIKQKQYALDKASQFFAETYYNQRLFLRDFEGSDLFVIKINMLSSAGNSAAIYNTLREHFTLQRSDTEAFIEFLTQSYTMALEKYFPNIAADTNTQINNDSRWQDLMISFRQYREPDMAKTIAEQACHSQAERIHILVGGQHSDGLLKLLKKERLKNPILSPINLEELTETLLKNIPTAKSKKAPKPST